MTEPTPLGSDVREKLNCVPYTVECPKCLITIDTGNTYWDIHLLQEHPSKAFIDVTCPNCNNFFRESIIPN